MTRFSFVTREIGVEHARDRTQEQPPFLRDEDFAAVEMRQPVGDEPRKACGVLDQAGGIAAMRLRHVDEINLQRAHQPLDRLAPHPIFAVQRDSTHGGEAAAVDQPIIGRRGRGVLHISPRQLTDGAGAEAEQHRRVVGGVTMKAAPQFSRRRRLRHRVARLGVMVEADGEIADLLRQNAVDRLLLRKPCIGAGQAFLRDDGLMLLHPGHVGVAEHGGAMG